MLLPCGIPPKPQAAQEEDEEMEEKSE